MISIVDASDFQYVLRPTVYRPMVAVPADVMPMRAAGAENVILMRAQRAEDPLVEPAVDSQPTGRHP